MTKKHKRQLRNYLIDRRYQLRYTVIMVLICSLLTAGFGYSWYTQMQAASTLVEVKALGSMSNDSVQQIRAEMAKQDHFWVLMLISFGAMLCLVVTAFGIVMTHRVAGPLHRIGRHMNGISTGKLGTVYDLRKGDQLVQFFDQFKDMHAALLDNAQQDLTRLDEIIHVLENAQEGAPEPALKALRELQADKKAWLGPAT